MNQKLKVAILKGPFPRHDHFARHLAGIDGIEPMVITFERLGGDRLKKMWRNDLWTFANRVTKYLYYALIGWNRRELDFFGTEKPEEVRVESLNSAETRKMLEAFQPDVIAVFGTPIISSKIIDIPRFGAINLHGGISPDYKGGNTIFWPLYRGEPEKAGATIHYMLKKVDSGAMLARIYPDLNPSDDEFSASAKTFAYATEEFGRLIEVIRDHRESIPGQAQEGEGSLYLAKHRNIWKDLSGHFRIRRNLRGIHLDRRLERFY